MFMRGMKCNDVLCVLTTSQPERMHHNHSLPLPIMAAKCIISFRIIAMTFNTIYSYYTFKRQHTEPRTIIVVPSRDGTKTDY